MEQNIVQNVPVIAGHCNLSLHNLLAIVAAGGKRDGEIEIEGYVTMRTGARQAKQHKLRALHGSDGGLVAYQRRGSMLHRGPGSAKREVDPEQTWQKTPSGPVDTMQLKTGRKGRTIPASHRNDQRGGVAVAHA